MAWLGSLWRALFGSNEDGAKKKRRNFDEGYGPMCDAEPEEMRAALKIASGGVARGSMDLGAPTPTAFRRGGERPRPVKDLVDSIKSPKKS